MTRKGKTVASGSESGPKFVYGFKAGAKFTEWPDKPTGRKKASPKPTAASELMQEESHRWLKWPGATSDERVLFTNKLAELQSKVVGIPRIMDFSLLARLGIIDQVFNMFRTRAVISDRTIVEYDMWKRAFELNVPAVREWCLEFYSSLTVDLDIEENEAATKKCIHFRLGGVQRHVNAAEFGWLTGMFTREELSSSNAYEFLNAGVWKTTGFPDDDGDYEDYWVSISDESSHTTSSSKMARCRYPILRVLHRMITYGFLQRSTHNDKPYPEDLFLLRLFREGSPARFANAPMVLAQYMFKHNDKELVCGHYITHMVQRLKLVDDPANAKRGLYQQMITIGLTDLRKVHLVKPNVIELIDEGVPPPRVPPTRRRRIDQVGGSEPSTDAFDLTSLGGMMREMMEAQNRFEERHDVFADQTRLLSSQVQRLAYNQEYSQPFVNQWIERERLAPPMGMQYRPYSPPPIFMPRSSTYGFFYPEQGSGADFEGRPPHYMAGRNSGSGTEPQLGSYSGGVGVSDSGAGSSSGSAGEMYAGHSFDYYGAGFFGEPYARDGDGTLTVFDEDAMEQ